MLVTDVGMATLANELHPSKAPSSMLATEVGIATLANELHPRKATAPMLDTDDDAPTGVAAWKASTGELLWETEPALGAPAGATVWMFKACGPLGHLHPLVAL